jgi:uncharacterized protein YyaL (SSP411 family)
MLQLVKERYWQSSASIHRWLDVFLVTEPTFRKVVIDDHLWRASSIRPVPHETGQRAAAAVRWLYNGQDATPDGGVSYGYFPVSKTRGWDTASYPETTGYIMTTLIQYARRTKQAEPIDRSHRMALWEAEVQMANGAVQGGKVTAADKQTPASFNTGMVLDGFVTLLEERMDTVVLQAAERAAIFLKNDLKDNGLFATNGEFVSRDAVKVYNVLCAWALFRFGKLTGTNSYCYAAVRAVEAALRFQNERGWFAENCLSDSRYPLTHTIGYTVQGILEVGMAAQRDDFIAASDKCWRAIIPQIEENGFLAGRFDSQWRPAVRWSCLTGSAQLSIIGYRLGQIRGDKEYSTAADRLVNFLKAVQRVDTGISGLDGALAGSYPIMCDYMTAGYPNWATKYLLDALMLQANCSGERLDRSSIS